MRLTLVVIYSFIFKPLGFHFFFALSPAHSLCASIFRCYSKWLVLLLLLIVIVFPFFFASFVFGWYSNLIKSHSTASLLRAIDLHQPQNIANIKWHTRLSTRTNLYFSKLVSLLHNEREHMFRVSSNYCLFRSIVILLLLRTRDGFQQKWVIRFQNSIRRLSWNHQPKKNTVEYKRNFARNVMICGNNFWIKALAKLPLG